MSDYGIWSKDADKILFTSKDKNTIITATGNT